MRWVRDAATLDFETLPIRDRPLRPPPPVGVAIGLPGKVARYLSWGHPNGTNNSTWAEARRTLGEIYDSGRPLLFHNAKFDVEVAEVHMAMPRLEWQRYHDTLYGLFLRDPHAPDFKLKESSERILELPPDEQDAIVDWLVAHQPVAGMRLSRAKAGKTYAGAYLAYAPAELVAPYAIGDIVRTQRLAQVLFKEIEQRGMTAAYDRERELMFHIMEMEQQGVRVATDRLERDIAVYESQLETLDNWLRKRLKAAPDLNLDSGAQLAAALIKAGFCTEEDLGLTAKGSVQTNKEALTNAVKDKQILALLKYRTQLGTCVNTFMKPWFEVAHLNNGLMFTEWHSTRTDRRDGGVGTRTGRLSSTPNFQNVPKEFTPLFYEWAAGHDDIRREDRAKLPRLPYKLPPLPLVRGYIIPYEKDHVLIDRDYSQQELRALGHFEGGVLMKAYLDDPWLDVHELAQLLINGMLGTNFGRKPIKNTGFGLIYGMGVGKLAERNGTDIETAKRVKAAYLKIFPGLKAIYDEAKLRAKNGQPFRTWGGREYHCEEPKFDAKRGRWMEYDYKLPNALIQGSSADITKEAMLRYCRAKPRHHKLLLTVHDQLTASVPRKELASGMELLRSCMESIEMDVPMLSEGSWSDQSWQALVDYDSKGVLVKNRRTA